MKNKEDIGKLLSYDALSEAEKVTGKSYKVDPTTEAIGVLGMMENNQKKNAALTESGDTTMQETESGYLKKSQEAGFKVALIKPFENEDGIEERFYVMWHEELSVLLVWETHTWGDDGSWAKVGEEVPPPSVNSAKMYYNWCPKEDFNCKVTSSGGFAYNGAENKSYSYLFNKDFTPHHLPESLLSKEPEIKFEEPYYSEWKKLNEDWNNEVQEYIKENDLIKIWSGDHDAREGLKYKLNRLKENGTFVKKWIEAPFLWLLNYMDTKDADYDHEAITKQRLSELPDYIQEKIGF